MSHLKEILVELENCVHDDEEYSGDIPVVWSREFQKKLSQNQDHWNNVQKRESHVRNMDFQDREQVRVSYDEDEEYKGEFEVNDYEDDEPMNDFDNFQRNRVRGEEVDELASEHRKCTYADAYREHVGGHEEGSKAKTNYGDAYRQHVGGHEEEEETKAKTSFSTRGMRSERANDRDVCYGTGMDFPRLKGDCTSCGGSGKAAKEEQAEEDPRKAANAGASLPPQQQQQPQGREGNPDEQDPENRAVDDQYGLDDPNDNEDFGEEEVDGQQEWDDPNYQGVIRTVPSAHLVFKRQLEDGTFDELWQYNIGDDFKKELKVRRAILAGTDIPINKMRSPDNSQTYDLWTVGNGQLLKVKGLPN